MSKTIVMMLPDHGFDPTETAVPWKIWTELGISVVCATPTGNVSRGCDPNVLSGILFGMINKISKEALEYYELFIKSKEYLNPLKFKDLLHSNSLQSFDGIFYPGGHHPDMKKSEDCFKITRAFWSLQNPMCAICHGVLALTRSGVVEGVALTTVPKYMESAAYFITKLCGGPLDFLAPIVPGTRINSSHSFVVESLNGRLLTGRFWGDAYLLAQRYAKILQNY